MNYFSIIVVFSIIEKKKDLEKKLHRSKEDHDDVLNTQIATITTIPVDEK